VQEEPRTPHRVAFIGHALLDEHVRSSIPRIGPSARSVWSNTSTDREDGRAARLDRIHVRSKTGDEVHLSFIGLVIPSRHFTRAMHERDSLWITDKLEAACRSRRRPAAVSWLRRLHLDRDANCRRVRTSGIALTTGNSLTVGMGAAALREAAREQGIELASSRLAVLGATGNIASTYAALMASEVREIVLVVRKRGSSKLRSVLAGVRAAAPGARVRVVDDLTALAECPLIVAASKYS